MRGGGSVSLYDVGRWQALRGMGSMVTDMLRRSVAAGALLYIRYTSALEAPAGGCGAVRVVVARGCIWAEIIATAHATNPIYT